MLRKAKRLRKSTKHKNVLVAPDRCPKERAVQKTLVSDLKKKRKDEPNMGHYLKGDVVCSLDVPVD